jgi:hypothetical protein
VELCKAESPRIVGLMRELGKKMALCLDAIVHEHVSTNTEWHERRPDYAGWTSNVKGHRT